MAGHRVSVLTRGYPETGKPPARLDGIEVVVGDRANDLSGLANREWDVVVDFAAFEPDDVTTLIAVVNRSALYVLISSIMAYEPSDRPIDEQSPLRACRDLEILPASAVWIRYGCGKVLAEQRARDLDMAPLIVRPGVIAGPGDPSHHLEYWYSQWERGSDIVVPGAPSDPVQFIDSRDLATWLLKMIERRRTGIFNAVGPAEPATMGELIAAIAAEIGERPISWIPTEWLMRRGVRSDGGPFFWVKPHDTIGQDEFWISYRVSQARARSEGLRTRSLSETVRDSLRAFRVLPPHIRGQNLGGWGESVDESSLLADWRMGRE